MKKIITFLPALLLMIPTQVKAAALGTGGTYTESGGYGIHTFTSSGTFTPDSAMNVEVLVVAGGGGAGTGTPAGGGGGGLIYDSSYAASGSVSVTVGAGGAGMVYATSNSVSGENSVFGTLTAIGGGRGGGGTVESQSPYINGGSGGSGGGGGAWWGSGTAGTGTASQGYAGGAGVDTSPYYGGGGGGAFEAGESAGGMSGGDGLAYSISGSSVYYAGGGGGASTTAVGSGGLGGGGNAVDGNGQDGGANTGGGGGGGYNRAGTGGSGGSGVVIIRYLLIPPTAPTIGTATVLSDTSIRWNFTDNADDETGFKVYDDSNNLVATCASTNLSYCDETGLTHNTSYTRKVVAYNDDGNSSYSSTDTASTEVTSCIPTLGDSAHTIKVDCTFSGYTDAVNGTRIVSGLDSGTGTTNTSNLTLQGGILQLSSLETLVMGSLTLTGGSVAIAEGAVILPGSSLWGIDSDGDGYPETTTFTAQVDTPTDGVRINTLTDATIADCNPTDPNINTSCCTAVDLYTDADGDGYGIGSVAQNACPEAGYSTNNTDCNDTGTSSGNVFVSATCYTDADDDGHGSTTSKSCLDNATCLSATWGSDGNGTAAAAGDFATNNTDCNDGNASKYTNNWVCSTCYESCCDGTHSNSGGTCGGCASGPFAGCSTYDVWNDPPTCYCSYSPNMENCNPYSCNCGWVCGT